MENYKNNYILELIQFINQNFENSNDLKLNIKNIKNLISFINNYEQNLDFTDIDILILKCPLLVNTIKIIKNNKELDSIFKESENEIFRDLYNNLVESINLLNKKNKEEYIDVMNDDLSYDSYYRKNTTVSEDIFNFYLKEINKIPLLTPEEEVSLAYEMRNGNENAKKRFIESNLRLVVSIAKRYTGKGLSILDLVGEGNIGLLIAVDRFDPSKGYKFSTYATYWIRLTVTRSIANYGRTIRISVESINQLKKLNRAQNLYYNEHQRQATDEELSKIVNISVFRIKELRKISKDTISLYTPIGEDKDTTIMDVIASDKNFEDDIIRELSNKEFMKIFNNVNLSLKERKILLLRAGYYDGKPKTLEEIGQMFGVTRERIRQLESRALKKLRVNREIKRFADNNIFYLQDYSPKYLYKKFNSSNTDYIEGTGIDIQKIKK